MMKLTDIIIRKLKCVLELFFFITHQSCLNNLYCKIDIYVLSNYP